MEAKETEFIYSGRTSKKQNFDKRLIKYIVGLAEQGVPRRDLILEYGMTRGTLTEWLRKYSSAPSGRRIYSQAEKRSVVRAVASGMSINQAHVAFNISHPNVVREWVRDYKEENAELSISQPVAVTKKIAHSPEDLESKALKKALEEANLKIRALNTMIDIAEEQLKIDIRKKSGAKQSSK